MVLRPRTARAPLRSVGLVLDRTTGTGVSWDIMQVLMLQFVQPRAEAATSVFSHGLGTLAALLKAEGFACRLVTLAGHRPEVLREAIIEHRPRYVLAELDLYTVDAAHRTIAEIAAGFSLPVAVLGQYATCVPAKAASIPGVHALVLGEYEAAAVSLLKAFRDRTDAEGLDGLWVNSPDGLVKGELAPLIEDLDALPFPDRDLFDYQRIVNATGQADFKVARGCGLWCAYCTNDWYMDLYADRGPFVRRRSPANVMDEVHRVVTRYDGVGSVGFYDHCFAADAEWLGEFAALYPKRCHLPYRCHVRLDHVTPEIASLLAVSMCHTVHVQLGSGSRFIREEVLSMRLRDDQIVDACSTLRGAGLTVSAEVFVGCPYESEITVEETLSLVRRAGVDEIHPRVYYPTPGTRAAELCAENGWTSGRGEASYWRGRSVLDMPSLSAHEISAVVEKFPRLLKGPPATGVSKLLRRVSRSRRSGLRKLMGR